MASSYHSSNTWSEVDAVIKALPFGTIPDLKTIILAMNERRGMHIARSGRKQELVDRITLYLTAWKNNDDVAAWTAIKPAVDRVGLPTLRSSPSVAYSQSARPSTSNIPQITVPQRSNSIPTPSNSHTSIYNAGPKFRFKVSPFFTVQDVLSSFLECPESFGPTDRRECTLNFSLNDEQLNKLRAPSSVYQVRLFCTSSKSYSPLKAGANPDLPIEFPPTCEVYINEVQLKSTLLKGIKKQPGTAPPPDLGAAAALSARNAVRMVYINHAPPGQQIEYKKFYLVAQLVQACSVSKLVDTLRQTRFISAEDIKQQMREAMSADDDIIAGTLKLSLKCPLSFARMTLPCRSAKCTHAQCFDASSWYAVMQQNTTWLCPICERVLDWRELIIDGFLTEILKCTPDTVDDVLLEADGTWRTADGRYSSHSSFSVPVPVCIELDDSDED